MVGLVSSNSPYSYLRQLIGASSGATTPVSSIVLPSSAKPASVSSGSTTTNSLNLPSLVLSLLQSGNTDSGAGTSLFQSDSSSTKNPVLNVLLANAVSSQYKAAYSAANHQALHSALNINLFSASLGKSPPVATTTKSRS